MNLHKAGLFDYYILMPIKAAGIKAKRAYSNVKRKLLKSWYCDGCKKYHSGRVVAYYECDICDGVCFKHIKINQIPKCESIMFGGKDITNQVKGNFIKAGDLDNV